MDNSSLAYLPDVLVINVPEVDGQHARLFEQLELFKAACLESNAFMSDQAEALFAYLVAHCETEERLAGEAKLDFRRHGEKHRVMLKGIRKRLDEMEHPEADVFGLIRYVAYWFERHIKEEDIGLGDSLRQALSPNVQPSFVKGQRRGPGL